MRTAPRLVTRPVDLSRTERLTRAGVHPVLARLFAARGVAEADELDLRIERLLPPARLKNAEAAGVLLADAIAAGKRLLIVSDYDADGATACAVGMRALRAMGANVDYIVPNRFELGYGLTPELVDLAAKKKPDLLITVDNGIASVEGVAHANSLGIETLITDHHLPGRELPAALCIVNPNQAGCEFPSKALAGVGVMFYVMLALRAEMRRRGALPENGGPNLGALTDLVALGTVADVASLDANNRILVAQGLQRLKNGRGTPGIVALLQVAGRKTGAVGAFDLGFAAGPRLNAAGRLADMGLGIETLISDDPARVANGAQELDRLNRERRRIEGGMLEEGLAAIERLPDRQGRGAGPAAVFFEPGWHAGVIGILASRLRERLHRPVVCFARADGGLVRGSGRSIPGFHLRDAFDRVATRSPGLIGRFGGHAQAAGLTMREADVPRFAAELEAVAGEVIDPAALEARIDTDGSLEAGYCNLDVARMLEAQVWGQNFAAPVFCDTFALQRQRVVGERHLKLSLTREGRKIDAIWFNGAESAALAPQIRAAYRLTTNEFNGMTSVQLTVEHAEPFQP